MSAELVRLFGTDQPPAPSRTLRAGRLEATLVEGGLRTIRFDGREAIRAIAYVVRDRDWGTYTPRFDEERVEETAGGFSVSYRAECRDADTGQILRYAARIEAARSGWLRFSVCATPDAIFETARCGFAVLHPLHGSVGAPARIEHVDGTIRDTRFPDLIEPWQPFRNIRGITHWPEPDLAVRCRLSGDVFEMEDQRAWSDASFKTYVRPIELPWPYELPAGIENRQSVELEIVDRRQETAAPVSGHVPVRLRLGKVRGRMPSISVVVHPEQIRDVLAHPALLRTLAPQRLLFHFDPGAGHDLAALRGFAAIAASAPEMAIDLEMAVPAKALDTEMDALRDALQKAGLRPDTLMVSPAVDRQSTPPGSAWPPCPPLEEVYRATREAFPAIRLGGGMLSYFTELNRKRPPVEMLDFVSHCTCPIVHAADDLSVMQSLEALPDIVRSTRAIIGPDLPYRIGPSTIGMRQNPYGSRLMPNPDGVRRTMTDRDPRQRALFAAAWTVGYAAATAGADLEHWVPSALLGSLGLAEASNGGVICHPVFFVVQAMAALAGWERLDCTVDVAERIAAVAACDPGGGIVLWVCNLTSAGEAVLLDGGDAVLLRSNAALGESRLDGDRVWLSPYAVAGLRLTRDGLAGGGGAGSRSLS